MLCSFPALGALPFSSLLLISCSSKLNVVSHELGFTCPDHRRPTHGIAKFGPPQALDFISS